MFESNVDSKITWNYNQFTKASDWINKDDIKTGDDINQLSGLNWKLNTKCKTQGLKAMDYTMNAHIKMNVLTCIEKFN